MFLNTFRTFALAGVDPLRGLDSELGGRDLNLVLVRGSTDSYVPFRISAL